MLLHFNAHFNELCGDAVHVLGNNVLHQHLAAGGGHGCHVRACLDLVGDDGIGAAAEAVHALDLNGVRTGAADVGAHGVEEVGQVHDVGLLGAVFDDGVALSHGGGHHDVHGGAHGDNVQIDVGALETAALGEGADEAALHHYLGAQGGKALDVLVDGADAAEVAAAGHGDFCLTEAAKQGTDEVIGSADLPAQLIIRAGGVDVAAVNLHRVGIDGADGSAQTLQDAKAHGHIGDLGDIFNAADPVHHQGGGDDGDSGVLCTADLHFTKQGFSTLDNIFRQDLDPLFKWDI